jgi:hypothetical protein
VECFLLGVKLISRLLPRCILSSRVRCLIIHAALSIQVVTKRGDYTEVDVKRYVRIEKIPGGELSECIVLDGVMFNKVRTLRLTC